MISVEKVSDFAAFTIALVSRVCAQQAGYLSIYRQGQRCTNPRWDFYHQVYLEILWGPL